MKLYLAGPMRGYPEDNHPAFHLAAEQLRRVGYEVHSPAEHDQDAGFVIGVDLGTKAYMKYDLGKLLDCDAVATLTGWYMSKGAQIEVEVARRCEMDVADVGYWLENAGVVVHSS